MTKPAESTGRKPESGAAQWTAVQTDLPPGASAKFQILWRGRLAEAFVINFEGSYYAYLNSCRHEGTPLDWWPNEFFTGDGRQLVCGTHGARYDPVTGECVAGPCLGAALVRLQVKIDRDRLTVMNTPVGLTSA